MNVLRSFILVLSATTPLHGSPTTGSVLKRIVYPLEPEYTYISQQPDFYWNQVSAGTFFKTVGRRVLGRWIL